MSDTALRIVVAAAFFAPAMTGVGALPFLARVADAGAGALAHGGHGSADQPIRK